MTIVNENLNGLDDLLTHYGEFGKFQKILYIIGGSSIFFSCLNLWSWNFMAAMLPHRCSRPDENLSVAAFNTSSFEYDDERRFQCKYKDQSCISYVYDTTQIQNSMVKEWDLVCGHSYIRATIGALPMAGYAVGGFFVGHFVDAYGRKLAFFLSLLLLFLSGTISFFSINYYMLAVGKTLNGIAASGVECAGYIYAVEIIGLTYRTKAAMGVGFFKIASSIFISIIAFFFSFSWRAQQLFYTMPLLLYVFCICFIPESPRWLLDKGKPESAIKVLKTIFRINDVQNVNEEAYNGLKTYSDKLSKEDEERTNSLIDLFSHKNMRIKTLILTFLMILCATLDYSLILNQSEVSDNPYIAFSLPSVISIPFTFIFIYSLDSPRIGRKKSLTFCLLTAGVCFIIHPLLPYSLYSKITKSILSISGRSLINCSINILQIFAFELFPTTLRATGLSFINTAGRFISSSAPYIILAVPYFPVAFGIASIFGGFFCFLLPETAGFPLPATLEESEKCGIVQFFSCKK